MDNLMLVSPKLEYEKEAIEYVNEFIENNSHVNGSAGLPRYIDKYKEWLKKIEDELKIDQKEQNKIPGSTFFAIRKNDKRIIGIINIRHGLNEKLKIKGGHIGYSVRPSERRKGYATEILSLGIKKLEEKGIKEALITCDKDNIGSMKTILKNCGVLENELFDEETGKIIQRYWIKKNNIVK